MKKTSPAHPGRINIIWLGIVSLLNDLSSEVITRVLPLFLLAVLGTSYLGVGIVEAISEATGILGKLGAGYFSDLYGKRKPFIFAGYTLSVITRPLIAVAQTLPVVASARFFEKIGKSVRTPPRDALIADFSEEETRGVSFGLHRALDTVGAAAGLLAVAVFFHFHSRDEAGALKGIILAASLAGVLALPVLWFFVKEAPHPKSHGKKISLSLKSLDSRLRHYLAICFLFALANSSDAFLIVRAKDLGISLEIIFLILMGFNVTSIGGILFFSKLSDRWGRKIILCGGWLLYAACYFVFGKRHLSPLGFTMVMLLYGAFSSFIDGVEKALVADLQPSSEFKGRAYGWLALVQGIGVVPANLIFAELYQKKGASEAFWLSGAFALTGMILLLFFRIESERSHA